MPISAKVVIACWSLVVLNNVIGVVITALNAEPQALIGAVVPVLVTGWVLKGLLERSNDSRRSVRALAFLGAFVTGILFVLFVMRPDVPVTPNMRLLLILLFGVLCALFTTVVVALSNRTATDWFCE